MNKINFQNGTLISKAKVTVNGTVYEVEPAEYEGTTPLNAENLNQIQTNAENAINTVQSNLNTTNQNIENLTTYSTEEKVVGTWIGGKPIYRKVYYATYTSPINDVNINIGFNNWDEVITLKGLSFSTSDHSVFPIPGIRYYQGTLVGLQLSMVDRNSDWKPNTFYVYTENFAIDKSIIIFEYTKTTD